jgi:hypothetical protein
VNHPTLILFGATAATTPPTLTNDNPVTPFDLSTWGFPQWVAVVGILTTAITLYVQFRKNRGDEVNGRMNIKVTLDKMIDDRVERQLTSAWSKIDELEERVGGLEGDLEKERQEKQRIKTVVKRFISNLLHWDQGGRQGEMPMPSEEDLALLDIEPWSDTAQGRMIEQVRREIAAEAEDSVDHMD